MEKICVNNELKMMGKEVTWQFSVREPGLTHTHTHKAAVHCRRNVNDNSQSSALYSNTGATIYEAVVPTTRWFKYDRD